MGDAQHQAVVGEGVQRLRQHLFADAADRAAQLAEAVGAFSSITSTSTPQRLVMWPSTRGRAVGRHHLGALRILIAGWLRVRSDFVVMKNSLILTKMYVLTFRKYSLYDGSINF
jgi:hypothetical protein